MNKSVSSYSKVAVIVLSLIAGALLEPPEHADYLASASIAFLLLLFSFSALGVVVSIGFITSIGKVRQKDLKKPSLFSPLFSPSQPLLYFDTGSLALITYGLGGAVSSVLAGVTTYFWQIPFFAGVGAWCGVRLSVWLYLNK